MAAPSLYWSKINGDPSLHTLIIKPLQPRYQPLFWLGRNGIRETAPHAIGELNCVHEDIELEREVKGMPMPMPIPGNGCAGSTPVAPVPPVLPIQKAWFKHTLTGKGVGISTTSGPVGSGQ